MDPYKLEVGPGAWEEFAIKTLIDKASLGNVDDNNEELINFCAVIEEVLSFRLRAARTWYGSGEPRAFWDYIQQSCHKVPNNCIRSIASLENIKSPIAKGRAWIRCALMEKRLSEYISVALQQTNITRQSYLDGAVMLSDDISTLCGELLGLNAIDFSFCLKGETLDFPSPVMIDYTPYLKFKQSPESIEEDHAELSVLNRNNQSNDSIDGIEIDLHDNNQWEERYKALESKFKLANEQKGYLEELVRRREYQIQETNKQRVTAINTLKQWQVDNKQERSQLETVILELQNQV
ncbi:hypothetical protein FSP39_000395 [Pinctada imbricata]|uniref:RUN domain-containing protein n=1 Tax=Pinctada imbricata TaxID=66713 RepID=A0AA88YQC4_PINIB|nr:hypothetical protein FSP39_000395 [Pinctada imbricata]